MARVLAAVVSASLVPIAVSGVARAGADDELPGLEVTTPVPDGFETYGAVRFRAIGSTSSTSDELLGVADLGVVGNRIEANFTTPRFVDNGNDGETEGDCRGNFSVGEDEAAPPNHLWFGWSTGGDAVSTRLKNGSMDCTLTFGRFAGALAGAKGWDDEATAAALTDVNAMVVVVDATKVDTQLVLRDASLDGAVSLGSFASTPGGVRRWLVTGYDFDAAGGFLLAAKLDLQGIFNSCLDTCAVEVRFGHLGIANGAPAVSLEASDAQASEGGSLGTGGSFADPDDDPLSISASGVGTLVDHGDGTWSWTSDALDEGEGTVVVTADDGRGGTTEDRFSWSVTNVAPSIVSLEPSATTVLVNAEVTWTARATDPGRDDVLSWSFDGSAGSAVGATTTYTARYDECGTYALAVTVNDGDGGTTSAVSASSITVIGATLVEPAAAGGLVIGQRGRVLPLKLVIGCGPGNRPGLRPEIWVGGGLVGTMREQEGFYRFNLRVDGPGTIEIAPFGTGGGTIDVPVRVR